MSETPLHSVSVAGVTLNDEGQVLLIKRRDNGEWQVPGGILELGEKFEEGVIREILEETGVRVAVDALTGVYKNMSKGVVALVYRCRPVAGTPKPTEEASDAKWLALEDAIPMMSRAFAIRVEDAARLTSQSSFSRAHDGVTLL